jgi:hypothetical protein
MEAKWMWADVGPVGHKMARMNPVRWTLYDSIERVAQKLDLIRPDNKHRPVLVRLRQGGVRLRPHDEEHRFSDTQAAARHLQALIVQMSMQKDPNSTRPAESTSMTKLPFRCENRSLIPNELVEGPFEEFEIAGDVYSTAYLIARNAPSSEYSISPFSNPQVRIVWFYFLFIVLSQVFVVVAITLWHPPNVHSESEYVDCSNHTHLTRLKRQGIVESTNSTACEESGKFAFTADVQGRQVHFHQVEASIPFYNAILTDGDFFGYVLRFVCCTWVFSQMYLQHFQNIRLLLSYHDFSCWFVQLKHTDKKNGQGWVLCIPMIQFAIVFVVTMVSFLIICAQKEAFDIVLNSLAFTFIAEVGSFFNTPLSETLASTSIERWTKEGSDIRYLYPVYAESNAVNKDGSYEDAGWYICEDEKKAGLLTDYKVRHNSDKYPHHTERLQRLLDRMLCLAPVSLVILGAIRCRVLRHLAEAETSDFAMGL